MGLELLTVTYNLIQKAKTSENKHLTKSEHMWALPHKWQLP